MADLSDCWSWTPATMEPMGVAELMRWHALAIERAKARAGIQD